MAYTPTEWQSGDIVTSEKLNKIENGIAGAGGGGASGGGEVLVANMTPNTGELDKTWQEIYDAPFCIIKINDNAVFSFVINKIAEYYLSAYAFDGEDMKFLAFATNAPDGYPTLQDSD